MARREIVTVYKDDSTARYVLHNAVTQRKYEALMESKDDFIYLDAISDYDIVSANVTAKKTPFYTSDRELEANIISWYDQQDNKLLKYRPFIVSRDQDQKLPLISEHDLDRKKEKVSHVTSFYQKLRKDVTRARRLLKRHDASGLGERLGDFIRNFYDTARSLSLGRKIWPGFIFGFSHTKFCERLGMTKTNLNRTLNLAAGLGLITKITPVEAKGIGEFWHKKYGVGMLQFKLTYLNLEEIERRWLLWLRSGIRLHDVTLGRIKVILGVDVETHPEVKDTELRKAILKANEEAAERREQQQKEIAEYNRIVRHDPFGLGHKRYYHDIRRQYSADDARTILADIIENHNSRCDTKWYENSKDPLLKDDTTVCYRVKAYGKTKFLYKKYSELPEGLLISEYQWRTARKYASAVISELYEQGLIAIITETRAPGEDPITHKFRDFLAQIQYQRGKKTVTVAPTAVYNLEREQLTEEDDDLKTVIVDIKLDKPVVERKITLLDIIKQNSRGKPNAP